MTTSDTQYELSKDEQTTKQYYAEQVSDWFSLIGFRMLVYITIVAFTMSHILAFSKLAEAGIINEGIEGLKLAFSLIVVVTSGFMLADFARGLSYATISQTGKHRGYLVVAVVAAVIVGVSMSDPGHLSGEHAESYRTVAWAMASLVGVEILRGGILEQDVKRLRGVLS